MCAWSQGERVLVTRFFEILKDVLSDKPAPPLDPKLFDWSPFPVRVGAGLLLSSCPADCNVFYAKSCLRLLTRLCVCVFVRSRVCGVA